MNPTETSFAAFALMLVGALSGVVLRRTLPDHHLDQNTKDVVRLGAGLVATISALVLGLLINSANGTYEAQRTEVRKIAADIILLDRLLAQYGLETKPIRLELRHAVGTMIDQIWGAAQESAAEAGTIGPTSVGAHIYSSIHTLPTDSSLQRAVQGQALQTAIEISHARLMLYERSKSTMPAPFLAVLVFWLTALFVSFCLFTPVNPTSAVALIVIALSASAALFLILEMGQPFSGFMQISDGALRTALQPLAQ